MAPVDEIEQAVLVLPHSAYIGFDDFRAVISTHVLCLRRFTHKDFAGAKR
jgi:hypothetical protein